MQPGVVERMECQSRLDEDAGRREQPVADVDDRERMAAKIPETAATTVTAQEAQAVVTFASAAAELTVAYSA